MSGKQNSRVRKFSQHPDRGQTSQQHAKSEQDKSPRPERAPPTGGEPSQSSVDIATLLQSDPDAASSVRYYHYYCLLGYLISLYSVLSCLVFISVLF